MREHGRGHTAARGFPLSLFDQLQRALVGSSPFTNAQPALNHCWSAATTSNAREKRSSLYHDVVYDGRQIVIHVRGPFAPRVHSVPCT